jgi:hypothetical protein
MNDKNEIETFVLDKFTFLQSEFGFSDPIWRRDVWITTISYLSKEIGIEIELDWRDLDVFILITKLDKGKLPRGYYVVNGRVCRLHLEEVLQNSLNVSKDEIHKSDKSIKKTLGRNKSYILTKTARYQQLLYAYAKAICNAGDNLFKNDL